MGMHPVGCHKHLSQFIDPGQCTDGFVMFRQIGGQLVGQQFELSNGLGFPGLKRRLLK
jgi:hypothetical protein